MPNPSGINQYTGGGAAGRLSTATARLAKSSPSPANTRIAMYARHAVSQARVRQAAHHANQRHAATAHNNNAGRRSSGLYRDRR